MLGINVLQKLNETNGHISAKILHTRIKKQLDVGKQVLLYFQPGKDQDLSGWSESSLAGSEQELITLAKLVQQEGYNNIAIIVITSLTAAEANDISVVAARQAYLAQDNISFFDDHEKIAYSYLNAEKQTVSEHSVYVFQAWILNKNSKVVAMLPRQANYLQLAIQVAERAASPIMPIKEHGNLLAPLILYSQSTEPHPHQNRVRELLKGVNLFLQNCQHIVFLFAHPNYCSSLAGAIKEAAQQAREKQTTFFVISSVTPIVKVNFFQDSASNDLLQKLWQWHGPLSCNVFECLTKAWVMNRSGELVTAINYQYTSDPEDFITNVLSQVPAESTDVGIEHVPKKHKIG